MAIRFPCRCGQDLEVDDEYAGAEVQCPFCQQVVVAPRLPKKATALRAPASPPAPKSPPPSKLFDDFENEPRRPKRDADEDEEDDRPRRRKFRDEDDEDDRPARRKKKPKAKAKPQSLEGKVFSGSVMGGCIAMLVAVVWFGVGLAGGIVFFYPPILFVIGLVGLIRGLVAGGGDE